MFTGFRAHFYFFDLKRTLLFFGFLLLFGLLIAIATIVHYFAYRWIGIRRNFNKIQIKISSRLKGLFSRDNTDLIAVRIDDPDFSYPNILVNSCSIRSIRSIRPSWCSYIFTSLRICVKGYPSKKYHRKNVLFINSSVLKIPVDPACTTNEYPNCNSAIYTNIKKCKKKMQVTYTKSNIKPQFLHPPLTVCRQYHRRDSCRQLHNNKKSWLPFLPDPVQSP